MVAEDSRFNPFPGLRPFQYGEQHLFFGREGQSAEILRRLREHRFLAVVGSSGSGKSSLIRAGLLPDLHGGFLAGAGSHWRIAVFRPVDDPIGNMARALNKPDVLQTEPPSGGDQSRSDILLEVTLRRSGLGLIEAARRAHLPENENLLVVVDQFEELFRFANTASAPSQADDATAFVKLLLEATQQTELPIYVVITMRSDFIGDCARFRDLAESVTAGMYLVPRMTREQRRGAIAEPVGVGGGCISLRLINRLLNEVGDNPDQLPILQHALMRTWGHWENRTRGAASFEKDPIDFSDYEAIGGLAMALSNHADEAYNALRDDRHREIAKRMFQCLTEKGADNREIRRPTSVARLAAVSSASVGEVIEVVNEFHVQGRSFLTTPSKGDLSGDSVIDISHESLIRLWTRLVGWVAEESESARMYERLADAAALYSQGKGSLWDGPSLQNALDWKKDNQPTAEWAQRYNPQFEEVMAFLDKSCQAHEEAERQKKRLRELELRRTRRNLAVVSVFSVVALGLAAFGWFMWDRAGISEQLAKAKEQEALKSKAHAEIMEGLATEKGAQAVKSAEALRIQALRVQQEHLGVVGNRISLLDSLVEKSTPYEAAEWHREKASLLIEQNLLEDAVKEAKVAIDLAPDNLEARTDRGYAQMLLNHPAEALVDFEYIRDRINSKLTINYLNLVIALAQLGREADASNSLKQAIYYSLHGENNGGSEALVPPEIQEATGRTALIANGEIFHQALYFLKPLLGAYAGRKDFVSDLEAAKEHAKQDRIRPNEKEDAGLIALTWAWFLERMNTPKYGLLAGQGALWTEAGYPDYAARHYDAFLRKHAEQKDSRYDDLAAWVRGERKKLGSGESVGRKPDSTELEVKSDLLTAEKKYSDAEKLISEAIVLEPSNVRLYFKRMSIRFREANRVDSDYRKASAKADEDKGRITVLEKPASTSQAKTPVNEQLEENKAKQTPEEQEKARQDELKTLKADEAIQRKTADSAKQKERQLYQGVIKDCETVLKLRKDTPNAYFYRAVANFRLEKPQDSIVRDLKRAIDLDPTHLSAMDWLAGPAIKTSTEEAARLRLRYQQLYPGSDWNLSQLAELQIKLKQFANAYDTIQKAIAIDPADYRYYQTRADAEKGLGYSEAHIQRDRAEGNRVAVEFLRRKGSKEDLDKANNWEEDQWIILSKLGDKSASDEVHCNSDLSTCRTVRVTHDSGEWAIFGITSVQMADQDTRIVQIKQGGNDGIVLGATGNVFSLYSNEKEHERNVANIGRAEVLSVEPQSALLRVKMPKPDGDGMVRAGDGVQLLVRTPKIEHRSKLWSVVKFNIVLEDLNGKKIAGFDTLYSKESPELDRAIYQKLLEDIQEVGRQFGDKWDEGKPISKGKFAGKPIRLREALGKTSREDLDGFFQYVVKFPATYFGHNWRIGGIYAYWVLLGMPEK
jgi:energy-coupling factor transporter ATP-binding protein EcfA2